jgi:hypothetical protein
MACSCLRRQNSFEHLHRCNQYYRDSINEVREMAVALRKPRSRAKLDAMCPAHCVTRWVYDFEIVKFIANHLEQTRQIFQDAEIPFSDELLLLRPLLEKIAIQGGCSNRTILESTLYIPRSARCVMTGSRRPVGCHHLGPMHTGSSR